MSEKTYSNPRTYAAIHDWPIGGGNRGTAIFQIENGGKKGERATRVTTGKPKKLTFAKQARIVDGSDGRTYIAEETQYGFYSIMRGDMKYQEENIHEGNPRFEMVQNLFLPGATEFDEPCFCKCGANFANK